VSLEALACDTAAVATKVGGTHPERAAAMGETGRRRAVERFRWPAIAGQKYRSLAA
jgi:hypothetical protein